MVTSLLDSFAQQLSDGSLALAEFSALRPKEDRFVELIKHYVPQQPPSEPVPGLAPTSFPEARVTYLYRVRESFAECLARFQLYEEQRNRIEFFVEHFRTFVAIGKIVITFYYYSY